MFQLLPFPFYPITGTVIRNEFKLTTGMGVREKEVEEEEEHGIGMERGGGIVSV